MSVIGQGIYLGGKKGNPVAAPNDVNFYDYDGTIRYSYTEDEFANLSAMPANPTHEGMTAQGWDWTLTDAKTIVGKYGKYDFVQFYDNENALEADIEIVNPLLNTVTISVMLSRISGSTVTGYISWGDGSSPTSIPEGFNGNISHAYESTGQYTIKAYGTNNYTLSIKATGNKIIKRVRFSSRWISGESYVLRESTLLQSTSMPKSIVSTSKSVGADFLYLVKGIRFSYFPSDITSIGTQGFRDCANLFSAVLPKALTTIGNHAFMNDILLHRIMLPENLQSIGTAVFRGCSMLYDLIIPEAVTSIGAEAFRGCTSLRRLWFFPSTPPSISASSAFTNVSTDCVIIVPYASLASYLSWTNSPSPLTYIYVGFATYQNGAALPSQDGTQYYNVTWYASLDDALSETSQIATGNGKRVYCRYSAA